MTLTGLCSVFQHALRLLAFGQLYKVLNMDPLPACKPSLRLLEGVCSVPLCYVCACPLCQSAMLQVMAACLLSAGSCQKRFREDVGSDDRDFIKRMKGDFDHCHSCFRESQLDHII